MLLEPETMYKVVKTEEGKGEYGGITWITVEVTYSPPVIEKVTKSVTAAKEGNLNKSF